MKQKKINGSSSLSGTVDGVTYNIAAAPLYFVRSGVIWFETSASFHQAGTEGSYRSSMTSKTIGGYVLTFYSSGVNPSIGYSPYNAYSLRCLAS